MTTARWTRARALMITLFFAGCAASEPSTSSLPEAGAENDAGGAPDAAIAGDGAAGDDAGAGDDAAVAASPRRIFNFDTDWLFSPTDAIGAESPSFDDSTFERVSLPHANKVVARHIGDPTGKQLPEEPRFVSWYRRHFSIPSGNPGRRVLVSFQAVGTNASVFVNKTLVQMHQGAYTPFTIDITSYIDFGDSDNVIAVRSDAREQPAVPPEGGDVDYLLFGGITRDVSLVLVDSVYIDGTFVSTPGLATGDGKVHLTTSIMNTESIEKTCALSTTIVDPAGKVVASGQSGHAVPARSSFELAYDTSAVASPLLWDTDHPTLYTAVTEARVDGVLVDIKRETFGMRSIRFDKTDGRFYLNGKTLKLRGLDRHETFPYIGRAAPNRLQARDAEILKNELGINIVRTSHYPQDPEFLQRCDEIGLLVLEELPGWNHIGDETWKRLSVKNVRDMIVRDRNHPSIVVWGVRINESGDDHDFYTETNAVAHALDPTRPTGGVRNFATSEFLEDVYTYNDFSGTIEAPTKLPWLVTENMGHTFPTHSWDDEARLVEHMRRHAKIHDDSAARSDVSGALSWCAFDYNTTSRFGEENICYHGVSDIFRIPKHAAYFYQSQRDPGLYGPMVYIANYARPSGSPTTVTIASNCEEVELFVGGSSVGKKKPSVYVNLAHPLFEFSGVAHGELRAEGRIGGTVVVTHVRKPPGSPKKLVLTPDAPALVADGADMTRVVASVVDENDQVVPYGDALVSLSVTGPGVFLGETPLKLENGRGAFFVQTKTDQPGSVTCQATANGLAAGTAAIVTTASKDDRVSLPTKGASPAPVLGELARLKPAQADSEESAKGNVAAKANDGDVTTRWCAADGNTGHAWTVDLGAPKTLAGLQITWEHFAQYRFNVEVSLDGAQWSPGIDATQSSEAALFQALPLSGSARYVRLVVTGLEAGSWACVSEVGIEGK